MKKYYCIFQLSSPKHFSRSTPLRVGSGRALYTSVMMNTTFGPTFMAIHKCTDKVLELKAEKQKAKLDAVIGGIDWTKFVSFTIFKTVPLFWIPAHTVTFLLPSEYQVMMAAALSVALGIILSFGNKKK